MGYLNIDRSVQDSAPVFLYEFCTGEQYWRYTSHPATYIWNEYEWQSSTLAHGEITQSGEINKDGLSIHFPSNDVFARQFIQSVPEGITTLAIRRGHIPDGEFVVYWRGRIVSAKMTGATITLECESIFSSLRRPGLRARYQRGCRHTLYTQGCKVNKNDYGVPAIVTAVSENIINIKTGVRITLSGGKTYRFTSLPTSVTLYLDTTLTTVIDTEIDYPAHADGTLLLYGVPAAEDGLDSYSYLCISDEETTHIDDYLPPFAAIADPFYIGGILSGAGTLRHIVHQARNVLYLIRPIENLHTGSSVMVFPGCNHNRTDCLEKFNNLDNYGGFPWIPEKNPMGGTSVA